MKPFGRLLLCIGSIAAVCGFVPSYAQTGVANRAAEIKRALQQAEFQIAADLADSAIAHFREHTPAQLAEIHALRALIFFEQGSSARGEEHLTLALQLDPGLQLDPIFFSPQIRERLEAIRPQIAALSSTTAPAVRYIVMPDPRLEAAWRSLLLPGWGQRFKGQKTKGRLFTISAAALAGAALASHILRQRAETKYLQAMEVADIKSRYDKFNRYHLLRNNLALALGVVWSAAALDALILRVEPKATRVGIIPSLEKNSSPVYLALQISL